MHLRVYTHGGHPFNRNGGENTRKGARLRERLLLVSPAPPFNALPSPYPPPCRYADQVDKLKATQAKYLLEMTQFRKDLQAIEETRRDQTKQVW